MISPGTEGRNRRAATEEAMREPRESLQTSTVEQAQLEQRKPKNGHKTTIMKIQSSLALIFQSK